MLAACAAHFAPASMSDPGPWKSILADIGISSEEEGATQRGVDLPQGPAVEADAEAMTTDGCMESSA